MGQASPATSPLVRTCGVRFHAAAPPPPSRPEARFVIIARPMQWHLVPPPAALPFCALTHQARVHPPTHLSLPSHTPAQTTNARRRVAFPRHHPTQDTPDTTQSLTNNHGEQQQQHAQGPLAWHRRRPCPVQQPGLRHAFLPRHRPHPARYAPPPPPHLRFLLEPTVPINPPTHPPTQWPPSVPWRWRSPPRHRPRSRPSPAGSPSTAASSKSKSLPTRASIWCMTHPPTHPPIYAQHLNSFSHTHTHPPTSIQTQGASGVNAHVPRQGRSHHLPRTPGGRHA